jgi:hypothetical protein
LLAVDSLYEGKTTEGIGIRSTMASVRKIYGLPARSYSSNNGKTVQHVYCFKNRNMEFSFTNSVVTGIVMKYYMPAPNDTNSACK